MIRICLTILLYTFIWVSPAFSQDSCGDPPPVANESLKGEIKGKAHLVSKFLGDAELSGKIEKSRTEIFSKYPEAESSRANAFFEYQVCVLLFADTKMSTIQKLEELKKVHREFQKPTVKKVSIVIQPSSPIFNNIDIGEVYGSSSTMEFYINDEIVAEGTLDQAFGSHQLMVNEGLNKFEFIMKVEARFANVNNNCIGQFNVTSPNTYQPYVVFKRLPSSPSHAKISSCKLFPLGT